MATCAYCNATGDDVKLVHGRRCAICQRAKQAAWTDRNRSRLLAERAVWRDQNREMIRAYHTAWRVAHGRGRGKVCGEAHPKFVHGMSTTPEYRAWKSAKLRCAAPTFPRYGARGITMCEAWRASFEAFLADVGPRPSLKHSIDRIDNDGHYEPGNVRWATKLQQSANRSTTKLDATDLAFIRHWLSEGHPQKHIAEAFNVDKSYISMINTGKAQPFGGAL